MSSFVSQLYTMKGLVVWGVFPPFSTQLFWRMGSTISQISHTSTKIWESAGPFVMVLSSLVYLVLLQNHHGKDSLHPAYQPAANDTGQQHLPTPIRIKEEAFGLQFCRTWLDFLSVRPSVHRINRWSIRRKLYLDYAYLLNAKSYWLIIEWSNLQRLYPLLSVPACSCIVTII